MAAMAPANKFSWFGLALIPIWFLLEIFFELSAAVLGLPNKFSRTLAITGLLGGFYVVWFLVNGLAP